MTQRLDHQGQRSAISVEAAQWLLRFDAHDVSAAEHIQYLGWLQQSPVHAEEMRRMLHLRTLLDRETFALRVISSRMLN